MIWNYKHENEWHQNDMTMLLHQSSLNALTMLAHNQIPSIIEIDDGFMCSKSLYAEVKRQHQHVITFDKLLKKATKEPLYTFLGQKLYYTETGTEVK